MSVIVYSIRNHYRSQLICAAMAEGITKHEKVSVKGEEHYRGHPEADVAVFYGLEGNTPKIFKHYARDGHKAVYVDLGYWGRHHGGRWSGYHKVVVNDRHPTKYFQSKHSNDRASMFGLKFKRWRGGRHILLAGMGGKGAQAEGYLPEQWERDAIEELRKHTDRPIIYRPKPSWKSAAPIPTTNGYSAPKTPIEAALADCHAVVTHHSNVAVDGLLEGVPAYVWKGVGVPMGLQNLSKIEAPYYPDNREQWAADIAYTQYSIAEMKAGTAWKYLRDEGLV